jgi:hypothetical protein
MCSIELEFDHKIKEFPSIVNASNYTTLKKNRVLYSQYTLHNNTNVCSGSLNSIYKSYELRRNVISGCLWNKRICLKECLNDKNR